MEISWHTIIDFIIRSTGAPPDIAANLLAGAIDSVFAVFIIPPLITVIQAIRLDLKLNADRLVLSELILTDNKLLNDAIDHLKPAAAALANEDALHDVSEDMRMLYKFLNSYIETTITSIVLFSNRLKANDILLSTEYISRMTLLRDVVHTTIHTPSILKNHEWLTEQAVGLNEAGSLLIKSLKNQK